MTVSLNCRKYEQILAGEKKYCCDTPEMLPRRNIPRKAWINLMNIHTLSDASDEHKSSLLILKTATSVLNYQ